MRKLPHPIVLVFGAGATRGALSANSNQPPPLDTDFFDLIGRIKGHGTPILAKRVLKDVWELYQRTTNISLEAYYRDIETRAIIGKFAKSVNQPKDWKRRQEDLEELIRRIYIHTTCETDKAPISPHKSELHSKILRLLIARDSILTFNYDLVIEESFESARLWNPVSGYGIDASGKSGDWCRRWLENRPVKRPGGKSKVQLFKLHGSINWTIYPNQTIRLKPRPYVVRTINRKEAFEKISILAPGWNKPIHKNPYKKFWREARLRLEKCKSLVILGYSLPETDLLAKALLAEVVRLRSARGNCLRELHLCDPNENVKQRFVELFTPALKSRGQIFKYANIQEFADRLEV